MSYRPEQQWCVKKKKFILYSTGEGSNAMTLGSEEVNLGLR